MPRFDLPGFPQFAADVLGLDPETRTGHLAIQKAIDGLALGDAEAALFAEYTGLDAPAEDGYPFALILAGRQSGKSEQAAARLVYEAVAASLAGDRGISCLGVSQGHREARNVLFGHVSRFFEVPLLADLVVARTNDTITLEGDVMLMVTPCKHEALRGLRCRIVALDEVAHFRSSEAIPLDREVWRAAIATVLTTDGKVLALSSPYAASGLAYTLHHQYYANAESDVLVWRSPGYILNPSLSDKALAQIRAVDPEGAAAEVEGEFLRNVSALLDNEVLEAAIDEGVTVRQPDPSAEYVAFVDVATGMKAGLDRWAVAVAHQEGGVAVLDALLVIAPPFSTATAAKQTAKLCEAYRVRRIVGDRFGQGFSGEGFAKVGLTWEPSTQTKSDIYITLASALSAGSVRLLDHPELIREARMLERRRGPTKDKVDHPKGRGNHDDAINVAAGALILASAPEEDGSLTWGTRRGGIWGSGPPAGGGVAEVVVGLRAGSPGRIESTRSHDELLEQTRRQRQTRPTAPLSEQLAGRRQDR